MSRGFLKDIGGKKRLRFVKDGYDANDPSVPLNKVIFDSEIEGCLQIYQQGTVALNYPISAGYLVTWPSLGYTPFVMLSFKATAGTFGDGNSVPSFHQASATDATGELASFISYPAGLWVKVPRASAAWSTQMTYTVFRLKVQ